MDIKAKWIYEKLRVLDKRLSIKSIFEKEQKVLYLGQQEDIKTKSLENFYREKTKEIVLDKIENISKQMGVLPSKIVFRKTKRRWGSCNHKNELSFAITLSQLPILCIKYIIIHELAHIKHKNHKREFYQLIKTYMSDYKEYEKIIKNYSPTL